MQALHTISSDYYVVLLCGHLQLGGKDFLILISNFYYFKIGKEK